MPLQFLTHGLQYTAELAGGLRQLPSIAPVAFSCHGSPTVSSSCRPLSGRFVVAEMVAGTDSRGPRWLPADTVIIAHEFLSCSNALGSTGLNLAVEGKVPEDGVAAYGNGEGRSRAERRRTPNR